MRIDPAVPFLDPRLESSLSGRGSVTATVRDLLTRTVTVSDYDVGGTLALTASRLKDLQVDTARVDAALKDSVLTVVATRAARAGDRRPCQWNGRPG